MFFLANSWLFIIKFITIILQRVEVSKEVDFEVLFSSSNEY